MTGNIASIFGGPFVPPSDYADPPEVQLADAMESAGLTPPASFKFDGQLHRFSTNGRKGDDSGWYVVYPDSIPAGAFGSWREGVQVNWRAKAARDLTPAEQMAQARRIAEAKALREREAAKRHEIAADTVAAIWQSAQAASPDHPYLKRKGIHPNGARVSGDGRLIVPLFGPDGDLATLQYISADGDKAYHPGGKAGGSFCLIGEVTRTIFVAEGFATGATIHEATGQAVLIAYSASNIPAVVRYARERHGLTAEIVIVADHDAHGVGRNYADQASAKYGARVVMPPIQGMDANDYAAAGHDLHALLYPPVSDWLIPADDMASQPAPLSWLIKRWLPDNALIMVHGPSGGGKAQPLSEPVLTPNGWTEMGNIKAGDYVIGSMGLPIMVQSVHPQGRKTVWEVEFSNGEVVRCCKDHLWTVKKSNDARPVTITTEQLKQKPHKTHWKIPLTAPVSFAVNGNPLPIDPYVLGCLIGDGGLTAYVGFSTQDEFIANEISRRLPPGHVLRHKDGCDYQIISERGQPNHIWTALRLLSLAGKKSDQKFVPDEYMTASPLARLELLQGLMDTDGYVSASNGTTADFSNSSLKLVQQVREIVMSLGGIANAIRTKQTTGLDCHTVTFRMQKGCVPFLLPRKAQRCAFGGNNLNLRVIDVRETDQSEEMQCIKVLSGDHLYVTKGYVLTHNTFLVLDWCLRLASGAADWFGNRVKPAPVVYLAGEGHHGLRSRVAAWKQHHKAGRLNMWLSRDGCDLNTAEGYQRVVDSVRSLETPPKLIVVDTLHRFLLGDENSAQDAKGMIDACGGLMREFGCSVLLVHHTGVSDEAQHRARGSSAWKGALDAEINIQARGDIIAIVQRKMKDAEIVSDIYAELMPVTIAGWVDEDGEPVASAVIAEGSAPAPKTDNKLAAAQKLFERAWHKGGQEMSEGKPYVTRSAFEALLEGDDLSASVIKNYLKPSYDRGPIHRLINSEQIAPHQHGWIAVAPDFSSALMLQR